MTMQFTTTDVAAPPETEIDALRALVQQWSTDMPMSTGAQLVNFTGILYNVIGSSPDPKIHNQTWRQLLIAYGIPATSPCYVDPAIMNIPPSHPGFDVGGHMTPNANGSVLFGGICYLMPLCSGHNNRYRTDAYQHQRTLMLELSGYMTADLAVSFAARLPAEEPYSLIYSTDDGLQTMNLVEEDGRQVEAGGWPDRLADRLADRLGTRPAQVVLLERKPQGTGMVHAVRCAQL